jgi:hypothetical protein
VHDGPPDGGEGAPAGARLRAPRERLRGRHATGGRALRTVPPERAELIAAVDADGIRRRLEHLGGRRVVHAVHANLEDLRTGERPVSRLQHAEHDPSPQRVAKRPASCYC